jgi:hypothetical protein
MVTTGISTMQMSGSLLLEALGAEAFAENGEDGENSMGDGMRWENSMGFPEIK